MAGPKGNGLGFAEELGKPEPRALRSQASASDAGGLGPGQDPVPAQRAHPLSACGIQAGGPGCWSIGCVHLLCTAVGRVPGAFGTQLPTCSGLSGGGWAGTPVDTFLFVLLMQEERQRSLSSPGS